MDLQDEFGEDSSEIRIPLLVIASDAELLHKIQSLSDSGTLEARILNHDAPPDRAMRGLLLFEVRLMEAFEDLNLMRSWRQSRPLQPIVAICSNDDEDFIVEAFKAGATNYLLASTPPPVLAEHLKSLYKLSEAPRLVEIQNHEMLRSMDAERLATEAKMRAEGEKKLAQAQAEANQRTRDILDNLHSGFFILDKDLRIGDTTSRSCEDIFQRSIAGSSIGACLGLAPGQEEFLKGGLEQLFEDFMPLEVNLSLLPKKLLTEDDRILGFTYTSILAEDKSPEKLIVEAVDLTQSVRSQEALLQTQRLNETLLRILSDKDPFRDFLSDSKQELAILAAPAPLILGKRLLHTLKGNSAVMGLNGIAELIHGIESEVETLPPTQIPAFFQASAARIEAQFQSFLQTHASILQINWGEHKAVYALTEAELNLLSFYIKHDYQPHRELAESILKRLRLRSVKSMLVGFDVIVLRLAEQLGKSIRFKLIGGGIKLDPIRYAPLMKSLVHAVRNACDHGIETADDRESSGKDPEGYIQFRFDRVAGQSLCISIQDDGAGIKVGKILRKAVELALLTEEEAENMPREQALQLIFEDGLSTAEQLSETSGRGVGMACIRYEVEQLQGAVTLKSREGVGTLCEIIVSDPSIL